MQYGLGMSGDRGLDVVIFGATSFAGQLVAEYLAGHTPKGTRIGLAGRSAEKLAAVQARLGPEAAGWPVLVADVNDLRTLVELANAARVVATTVGPYRQSGINLVEACVSAGTHYADLTGEVLFIRDSIDRFHNLAARKGVRVVHSCGFDSIPSDLGALLLHNAATADSAGDLQDTTLVVKVFKGSASGGTVASMKLHLDELRNDPQSRRIASDPYALSPDRSEEPDLGDESDLLGVDYDRDLETWFAPFVMAGINTRVVRRSNALKGWAYGRQFRYREVTDCGPGPAGAMKAAALTAALGTAVGGLSFRPSRALLDRVLPRPGTGPDEKARKSGRFDIEVHTRTSNGVRYVTRVAAEGDPGYASTSVMLGESALCLALDHDLPEASGVLTPATAMGVALAERLRAAGQTLTTTRVG
jgi:short subunit dehydrogenase-like uncharacterized protein